MIIIIDHLKSFIRKSNLFTIYTINYVLNIFKSPVLDKI